ncbi:hypothetical protein DL93DRAFT_2130875 [Clavulina sp. PMI_390]|nr:hypothetical protein DL93DRAFT_2130875 [Clavulina sp. PMI_390]
MPITIAFKRRTLYRVGGALFGLLLLRQLFSSSAPPHEITHNNYIERVTKGADKYLDVQKLPFLQSRMGREDDSDLFSDYIKGGTDDFWSRFQIPFMNSPETVNIDAQALRTSIEDLLSLHGWVAADCPTLNRPFGQNKIRDAYDDLAGDGQMYYIAIIIHSADHFLVDQLATIVQLARTLGTRNLFVSMLDYDSTDSTPTLLDLAESVLTLLSIPFRIRRVLALTSDEKAGYYPLEEAYTRNLALEPLHELRDRRGIKFDKVVWLKGFTCPNDILESIKVSQVNKAAMTCGMDWAENNGFFVFSDRWRTRDMDGDQFRVSRSTSLSAPPREEVAAKRYAQHLPFQVFCCESGTHIVDPAQTYYGGIKYRYSHNFFNSSSVEALAGTKKVPTEWDPYGECMDSTQAWFCRDIWLHTAEESIKLAAQPTPPATIAGGSKAKPVVKRQDKADEHEEGTGPLDPVAAGGPKVPVGGQPLDAKPKDGDEVPPPPAVKSPDSDADRGSDFDTVPENSPPPLADEEISFSVPNLDFTSARIIINPRTVTTYAGVSHAKLANDLFGADKALESNGDYHKNRYVLEEWKPAPDSYVCQEQRFTGGRKSPKNQRSSPFSIDLEIKARRGQL